MKKIASVIMPVFNGQRTLRQSLKSIFNTTYTDFEVIIVNDASQDGSSEIAKEFSCQVFDLKENIGPARARNYGVRHSQGEVLLFTDSDCFVEKDWVKKMVEEHKRLKDQMNVVAVMGGRVLPNKNFVSKCLAYSGYFSFQHGDKVLSMPHLCASNLLVERKVFDKVGGFNEDLIVGEDTDISCNIYQRGFRVLYNPFIHVIHDHDKTMLEFFKHQMKWGETIGLDLEIKYKGIRKLNPVLLNQNPYFYLFILSVPVSVAITLRSMKVNFKYDKSILLCAPFIFMSKLAYRLGIVKKLFKQRRDNLVTENLILERQRQ